MPAPAPRISRRLPEVVRRRLEVASAMAWEALVDTQTRHALDFVALVDGRMELEDALDRYLEEMGVTEPMATAVRTRALVALEPAHGGAQPLAAPLPEEVGAEAEAEGWRRFRPEALVRGVRERQRKADEMDRLILLATARAEEAVIRAHVDNAITFAALLEPQLGLERAVQEYLRIVDVAGARGQAVFQRTMARLADVHLPPLNVPAELPEARNAR